MRQDDHMPDPQDKIWDLAESALDSESGSEYLACLCYELTLSRSIKVWATGHHATRGRARPPVLERDSSSDEHATR
jgi:hypothetical protein